MITVRTFGLHFFSINAETLFRPLLPFWNLTQLTMREREREREREKEREKIVFDFIDVDGYNKENFSDS